MRSKIQLLIVVAIMIIISAVIAIIGRNEVGLADVLNSHSQYKSSLELNSDLWINSYNTETEKLDSLNNQKAEMQKNLEDIQKTVREKEASKYSIHKHDETMSGSLAYKMYTTAGVTAGAEISRFYVQDPMTYTVKLTGTLDNLNATLSEIRRLTEEWGMNIGNMSIRQNYDAYNLGRKYDSSTKLSWYDNKIINALGEVIDLNDLKIEEDEDTGLIYSVVSLDEVKFDTEGRDMELMASNSTYEQKMTEALSNYANQLTIVAASDYTDEVKDEIQAKLADAYENSIEDLKAEKEKAANNIEAKYQRKYTDDKNRAAAMIRTYEDRLDSLRAMLADSSGIEYKMDLTIRYNEG